MFIPAAFDIASRTDIANVLRQASFGHLVTPGDATDPLQSTSLPFVVDDDITTLRAHFARANPHWKAIDGHDALMIVSGEGTYISPRWYESKREHGKVVPTWNYELVHLRGTIEIHDDPTWTHQVVTDLTRLNEATVSDPNAAPPWEVTDAPDDYIAKKLRAIVGVQLNVTSIEAKRKMSQNDPDADREGVAAGLARSSKRRDIATAGVMDTPSD